MAITVKYTRKEGSIVPEYKSAGASGADVFAFLAKTVVIKPGERCLIPTGISVEIPEGYEAQIRPRSGLALKYGITVLNSPGTIDSDYRGDIGVVLINLGNESFSVSNGDRIAQFVLSSTEKCSFYLTSDLGESTRGIGGYGSTGIS